MTMEAMPIGHDRDRQMRDQFGDAAVQPAVRKKVLVKGGGANTDHMWDALDEIGADVSDPYPPSFDINPDHFLHVETAAQQAELDERVKGGDYDTVYLSLPESLHAQELEKLLLDLGAGVLKTVIVPKPYVQDIKQMHSVRAGLAEAIEKRARMTGSPIDTDKDPLVVIHEHYIAKDVYEAFRKQLTNMSTYLGRLSSVVVTIQEAKTIEEEGRLNTLKSGILNDLTPHTTSIILDMQRVINESGHQTIANRSIIEEVELLRDKESELTDPDADTAFIIRGSTTLTDHQTGETHPLTFIQSGGKGLGSEDNKKIILEFVHPKLGISTVIVDLKNNKFIDLPEQIQHLFPEDAVYEDTGYGDVIRDGLGRGDLSGYQSVEDAEIVTKFITRYNRLRQDPPAPCDRGISL